MSMNSLEEDAFFKEWGWEKDLIQRKWIAPDGQNFISFDTWMKHVTMGKDFEQEAKEYVMRYGVKQGGSQ